MDGQKHSIVEMKFPCNYESKIGGKRTIFSYESHLFHRFRLLGQTHLASDSETNSNETETVVPST